MVKPTDLPVGLQDSLLLAREMGHKEASLDLFLSCGELSADVALARLLEPLGKKVDPWRIGGVLGPNLVSLGFRQLRNLEGLQVMGFTDVLKSFFLLRRHQRWVTEEILRLRPKVVILADYPGFHLRLAKCLRKAGYQGRLIQYVCPSIWAWKAYRLRTLEKFFDEVWGLLPFEKPLFESKKIAYHYVGNPSLAMAIAYHNDSKVPCDKKALGELLSDERSSTIPPIDPSTLGAQPPVSLMPDALGSPPATNPPYLLGLFPGSRPGEIKTHLPLLLQAAALIDEAKGKQRWYIALASESERKRVEEIASSSALTLEIVESKRHQEVMRATRAAIAVSGTVCLELALCAIPTLAVYQVSRLNYWLAKYLLRLKLKAFTLPNILLGKTLFPEYIGLSLQASGIAQRILEWLDPNSTSSQEIQRAIGELYRHMVACEKQSEAKLRLHHLALELGSTKADLS